jgi:hypothetical protein
MMYQEISSNLNNPQALEALYRSNKAVFTTSFSQVLAENPTNVVAICWHERLNFDEQKAAKPSISWWYLVFIALISGFILESPKLFSWDQETFYEKHIALVLAGALSTYFLKSKKASLRQTGIVAFLLGLFAGYINLVQLYLTPNIFLLSALHLGGLCLFVYAYAFLGDQVNNASARIRLLKFSGDLLIICGLLLIGFFLLTALSINLFEAIGVHVGDFFGQYIVVWLLAPIPMLGAYLLQSNNHLVSKISPIIAKIFSPLALVSLAAFLITYFVSGNQSIRDRDFLLLFNAILIAVLALIFFSIANQQDLKAKSFAVIVLFLLSIVAIAINFVALMAILERITMNGFSANKTAVLGSNVLILVHLLLTAIQLTRAVLATGDYKSIEHTIVQFLPIYAIWLGLVCFGFPLLF